MKSYMNKGKLCNINDKNIYNYLDYLLIDK